MAYKFSRGIYKHSGSLTAEHGAAVDQGGLTVSAGVSALQAVTATGISGSGNLQIGGTGVFAGDVTAPAFHGALDAAEVQTHISVQDSTELDFSYAAGVVSADLKADSIANSKLVNKSVTVAGHEVALGESISLDTGDISEGSNLYWTVARGEAMFDDKMAAASTSDLAEGSNLYYTDARVQAAVSAGEGLHYDGAGQFALSSSVAGAGLAFNAGVLSVDTAEIAAGLSGSVENIVRDFIEASDFVTFDDATGTISIDAAAFTGSANAAFDAQLATKSTDDLAEGSNLYWTVARGESMFDSKLAAADTGDLAEGSNLYWTVARGESMFDSKMAAADTGDLAEGSNLYWTVARGESMFDSKLAAASTSDLAEGSNLYYTDARVHDALSAGAGVTYDGAGEFSISAGAITNSMLSGAIENAKLVNSSVEVVAGNGLSGGGLVALGNAITVDVEVNGDALEISGDQIALKSTIAGNRTFSNDVTVNGNFKVAGTTTYIDTTNLLVKDALITIASGSATFAANEGIEFGSHDSLKTAVVGGVNVLQSSLPLLASTLYGNLVGTMQLKVVTKSANYTLVASDNVVRATSNITLTLPASPVVGEEHKIKCLVADASSPAVAISAGAATIDGDSQIVLESYGAGVSLVWDGSMWMVF